MSWEKKTQEEIKSTVLKLLKHNCNYRDNVIMGYPASFLDKKVFNPNLDFLEDAPYLKSFIDNPNHIGMHTQGKSIEAFRGTQKIELDLLRICGEEIFKAEQNSYDGYVSTGGTECNIQALWTFREFYRKKNKIANDKIAVIFSKDTHYSLYKACNILDLDCIPVCVDSETREFNLQDFKLKLDALLKKKIKHLIVVLNMGTTTFGSVDNIEEITLLLDENDVVYKIHVDAAFGGFMYPFTNPNSLYDFRNLSIDSIGMDAHKLLQSPYGTGIFMIRKGYSKYVETNEATYIEGMDHTLCGSRSGANAIAVWMILNTYGKKGLIEKMKSLIDKTDFLAKELENMGVSFYRNNYMNIIAVKNKDIPKYLAIKYGLSSDTYCGKVEWWKIVIMDHLNWIEISNFKNDMLEYTTKSSLKEVDGLQGN